MPPTATELEAVRALVQLTMGPEHPPKPLSNFARRELALINDWNGAGRVFGGVGIATLRKRLRVASTR